MKLLPLLLLLLACGPLQNNSETSAVPALSMTDDEVWNQELRVLESETPRDFKLEVPSLLFAQKGAGDSAAHIFLMKLGQQIFQQSLLAVKSKDLVYADNALRLINSLVAARMGFSNDPKNPTATNDNRFLEISWFLSLAARGAHILDAGMPAAWKVKNNWNGALAGFNGWIGSGIDQNWAMADAGSQTPLNLAAESGLLNWMGRSDTLHGATNRTFAALEAQMRVAELRHGVLGRTKIKANAWQKGLPLEHDGSMGQLFASFRGYLRYYFNAPVSMDPAEFKLNYNPNRVNTNSDPNRLNIERCLDPLQYGFKADCLLNKDAYRNDTYHAQMGLASIMHIIDMGQRWGYELSAEEKQKVLMGLRWASLNNTPGVTSDRPAYVIAVWELAFQNFKAEDLGPYCQRDLEMNRRSDNNKKAALAWGYARVARGS